MGYSYSYSASEDELIAVVLSLLATTVVMSIIGLICYIFESIGVYSIASRRGIKHPWLAWIPIGNVWLWGCISDQYQYVAKGRVKNRRKVLLVLSIIVLVLAIVVFGMLGNVLTQLFMSIETLDYMSEAEVFEILIGPLMSASGLSFVMSILTIVLVVFQYIVLYDIYRSCNPDSAVLLLLLSIFFGIVRPFALFANRKKDEGMPARRNQPAPPAWQNVQPVQQTWQNPAQPVQPIQPIQPIQPVQPVWQQEQNTWQPTQESPEPWTSAQQPQDPWSGESAQPPQDPWKPEE